MGVLLFVVVFNMFIYAYACCGILGNGIGRGQSS